MSEQLRLVLFDLGGVVCYFVHARRLAALSRVSGLTPEEVHRRLFPEFDLDCDRGRYTIEQIEREISQRLGVVSTASAYAALWAQAFTANDAVLELVSHARKTAQTGIFTNNGPLVDLMLREQFPHITKHFDHLCFSYQVGATKPQAEAYLRTIERLGFAPEQTLFIDDVEQNVVGAKNVGVDAILFVSADALASELQRRLRARDAG